MLGLLHPLDRGLDGVDPRLDPPRGRHLPRRLRLGRQPLAASAPRRSSSPRAATPPARSASCAAPTRPPARSSRAARRGARPRWSSSTSTTPTSRSSSGARRKEEEKARVLEPAGYDMSLDSPDWASIQYQNANNSVRVTDAFMEAARGRRGLEPDRPHRRHRRRHVRRARPAATDRRGGLAVRRPGRPVRHDDQLVAHAARTRAGSTRPTRARSTCTIDDSACNLASLNLMKFRREDGELDVEAFEHAVDTVFLAQEILVGYSSYPTPEIERNAKAYRQLGLGYANLGALLMARGLPYDSDEGRAYAAADHGAHDRPRLPQVGRDRRAHGPVRRLPAERRRHDRRDREAPRRGREHRARRLGARATCSPPRARHGTTRSTSARSTASATRRRPCSRRPGRSAS